MKRRNLLKTLLVLPFGVKALKETPITPAPAPVVPPPAPIPAPPSVYAMESNLLRTSGFYEFPSWVAHGVMDGEKEK